MLKGCQLKVKVMYVTSKRDTSYMLKGCQLKVMSVTSIIVYGNINTNIKKSIN